jgi:membrane-associated protein
MTQKIIEWILSAGYGIMALVIFVETGLLVGFFLPGDSLLFSAGLACVPGNQLTGLIGGEHLNFVTLNLCLIPAAIIGDTVGYWIGFKAGQKLYAREGSFFFRKDHLLYTKNFYEKHGGKTIVLARFIPLLRTFAPVVAGIGQMPYRKFISYNVFGGIAWVLGLSTLGFYLGKNDWIKANLELTLMLIIFVSVLPAILAFVKAKYFDSPMPPEGENVV